MEISKEILMVFRIILIVFEQEGRIKFIQTLSVL